MPAAFSEEDRERITELLLERGRELFTTRGLGKTSLAELVEPAGMAKTSFYAFFDSKEALYLELLMRQAPEVTRSFREALAAAGSAREGVESIIREGVRTATGDPLYRRLLSHPEELAAVTRKVGQEEAERSRPYVLEPMLEFIRRAQERGEMTDADPMVIVGAIQAVSYTVVHADELGPNYPQILELLTTSIAKGLTTEESR